MKQDTSARRNCDKMRILLTCLSVALSVAATSSSITKCRHREPYMRVRFPSGVESELGNELTPTQVKDIPCVSYPADKHCYYTVISFARFHGDEEVVNLGPNDDTLRRERIFNNCKIMTDPYHCDEEDTIYREYLHWIVVNIPGDNVAKGEEFVQYVGSAPPKGTGFHRYTFLVYKQPGKIQFNERKLNNTSYEGRNKFCLSKLTEKYCLGDMYAGNYYYSQYDDYVPIAYKKAGAENLLKEYKRPS